MMGLVRGYFEVAVLLVVGWGALSGALALIGGDARRRLRWAQAVFAAVLLFPAVMEFAPREALPRPAVQVWSGVSRRASEPQSAWVSLASVSAVREAQVGLSIDRLRELGIGALVAVGLALALYLRRYRRLSFVLREAVVIRRLGRVKIAITETELVPFSARTPRAAYVVLPLSLLSSPSSQSHRGDFALAVKHELQHHRQRDTIWVHGFELIRALFFWNPAAHAWSARVERLQELACDEALVGRPGISPQAYGSCLLRAAQQALSDPHRVLVGTTGMASGREGRFLLGREAHFLKRRIEMLFMTNRKKSQGVIGVLAFAGVMVVLAGTEYWAHGAVRDRRLNLEQLRSIAGRDSENLELPLTINERVLERLNRYVGTPEGREYVKGCFSRMPIYRSMIEGKLAAAKLPLELLAMPMQESCFRNDIISPSPYRARGIWQFIQPTALNYGLVINDRIDERLDAEKETAAAVKYLTALKGLFGDWWLAIKAYNEGERRVQSLIDRHYTRDAWALEEVATAENYLAGVTAMALILKHPSLME